MRTQLPILLSAMLVASFSCQKERQDQEMPEVAEKPLPAFAMATIASVQMLEDCPDPKPALPAPATPVKEAEATRAAQSPTESAPPSDRATGYVAPCQQSTIQIDFAGQGLASAAVVVKGVRLLAADGTQLAALAARMPMMWDSSVYLPWNEVLQPTSDLKVSYKLTPPNWSDVESKIGGRSHGKMFMLEATIEIGGQTQVVRSTAFARIQPEMVPT